MIASIVIPVYNRANFIEACLNSLLKQNFTDYEIIVVDDASTDQTVEIVRSIKDLRIHLIQNSANRGPGYAKNQGIAAAQGHLIAFTDSDCEADANWLKELLKPFNDEDVTLTGGKIVNPKPQSYWELVNEGANHISFQHGIPKLTGCNMAGRKDFLVSNPFNEFLLAEDWDLCLLCKEQHKKVVYTDKALILHHSRTSFKDTFIQNFAHGYSNAYINVKHRQAPFINYGALLLIMTIVCWGLISWNSEFSLLGWAFFAIYLALVGYWNTRGFTRSSKDWGITFPGYVIMFLAFCLGNMTFPIVLLIEKNKQRQGQKST
jgi:glycosyltransferase involved in cell wall biosynthesis